ncbi:hypothetical protein MAR_009817 [Mya arenaria]|uniref:Uncharacterized protein n=1 Tax=Mya arenaria TaxID=6604 RepID=A0ABY7E4D7_MYAAR|nr:hypothetical protein MAR_009817 [Mya arenaria]
MQAYTRKLKIINVWMSPSANPFLRLHPQAFVSRSRVLPFR